MGSRPGSADPAEAPPRRFLIATGTAKYRLLPEDCQLPSVAGDLRRIVTLFVDKLGYERVLLGLGENPESGYFSERLGEWLNDADRKSTDQVVLYYSGHGGVVMGKHFLMMTNSDANNVGTAFLTANLGLMLSGTPIRQMMVILDTCHAAAGSIDFQAIAQKFVYVTQFGRSTPRCFYALAAARPKGEASQRVFSEAFVRAAEQTPFLRSPRRA